MLGSLAGFLGSQDSELSRGLAYFPYFLLGAALKQHPAAFGRVERLMGAKYAKPAGAGVLLFWLVIYWATYTGRAVWLARTDFNHCVLNYWTESFYMGK
eukprot:SAG22_NODE_2196_length_2852_cov_4.193244_2_plen_99_part_00